MKREIRVLAVCLVALLLLSMTIRAESSRAAASDYAGRKTNLVVSYTRYEWWIIRWAGNTILCQLFTDHEGLPESKEILKTCGSPVHAEWKNTPPCDLSKQNSDPASCLGVYLFLVSSEPAEKTIQVDLPPPAVWLELSGCTPTFPENICPQIPSLRLTGEEPLPNEQIIAIHAILNEQPFNCEGAICEIPLRPTLRTGMTLEFWADSSFGDSSQHFTALVRVIDTGVSPSPGGGGWYVDILSSQWRGRPLATCAQTWQAFPPFGGPPPWLSTPEIPELLASEEPYAFLAGRLISAGVVDASGCSDGGILKNGYANACGLEKALPKVLEWQNQFDARIIEVAQKTGVPAQMLKNLIAQESQFWPGMFNSSHLGLGHLTERGVEALLLWNPSFFNQFCPLILDESACEQGYLYLSEPQRAILRGALANQAKADCPECPVGIDLANANINIQLLAQTLLANCEQVAQIVFNATSQIPGEVSSYEDLWRFTVANYHAGPGCVSFALYNAADEGDQIDWKNVSQYFTPACQGVVDYVEQIAK